jgi:hypothetical protein
MQLHFDLELAWLGVGPAPITDYAAVVGDVAGNVVHSVDLKIKLRERYLPDPYVLLIRGITPNELVSADRDVYSTGIGKIAWTFDSATQKVDLLPLTERTIGIEVVTRSGRKRHIAEPIKEYPLRSPNGDVVYDVRYHSKRKQLSYRLDADTTGIDRAARSAGYLDSATGETWILAAPRLLVSGYRIWPEIDWLTSAFLAVGYHPDTIFFGNEGLYYTVDCCAVASHLALLRSEEQNGLRLGKRPNTTAAHAWDSLDLRDVMVANSVPGEPGQDSQLRLRMPDGTVYDRDRHHSLVDDATASFALYNYMRRLAPDLVAKLERQADRRELENMLRDAEGLGALNRPPLATTFHVHREPTDPEAIRKGTFVAHAYHDRVALDALLTLFPHDFLTVLEPVTVPIHEFVSSRMVEAIRAAPALVYVVGADSQESEWVTLEKEIARRTGKPIYRFDSNRGTLIVDRSRPVRPVIHAVAHYDEREMVGELLAWLAHERDFELETFDVNSRIRVRDLFHHLRDFSGTLVAFASQRSINELPMKFINISCEEDPVERMGPRPNVLLAMLDPAAEWIPQTLEPYLYDRIDLTDGGRALPWSSNRLDDLMVRVLWRQARH